MSNPTTEILNNALAQVQITKLAPVAPRVKLTPEEREAKKKQLERERAERKAAREAKKAAKQSGAPGAKVPHLAKVTKAAANLLPLSAPLAEVLKDIKAKYTPAELEIFSAHLGHSLRLSATVASKDIELAPGQQVKIRSSADPRYIGHRAVVTAVNRIRCYVDIVDGATGQPIGRQVYLFKSDVELFDPSKDVVEADAEELDFEDAEVEESDEDLDSAANG